MDSVFIMLIKHLPKDLLVVFISLFHLFYFFLLKFTRLLLYSIWIFAVRYLSVLGKIENAPQKIFCEFKANMKTINSFQELLNHVCYPSLSKKLIN
jgi:hypothetical protein